MTLPAPGVATAVVVADDHPTFREGLRAVLEARPDLTVVAACASGEEALAASLDLAPGVVLMDLAMPGLGGVEATRRLTAARPAVSVVVLTMSDADDSVFAALRAGARGYLLKEAPAEEIVAAVRAAASGHGYFGARVARRITAFFAGAAQGALRPFPELSDRELEVLELLAGGASGADVARRLCLSPKTVRNHVSAVLHKLAVADRAAAVARARDAGLGAGSR